MQKLTKNSSLHDVQSGDQCDRLCGDDRLCELRDLYVKLQVDMLSGEGRQTAEAATFWVVAANFLLLLLCAGRNEKKEFVNGRMITIK